MSVLPLCFATFLLAGSPIEGPARHGFPSGNNRKPGSRYYRLSCGISRSRPPWESNFHIMVDSPMESQLSASTQDALSWALFLFLASIFIARLRRGCSAATRNSIYTTDGHGHHGGGVAVISDQIFGQPTLTMGASRRAPRRSSVRTGCRGSQPKNSVPGLTGLRPGIGYWGGHRVTASPAGDQVTDSK